MTAISIEPSWKSILHDEFDKQYFTKLVDFLNREKQRGVTMYPSGKDIFHVFDAVPFEQVKVVVLGQDPYHRPNQAMGLSFSVPKGIPIPPSLRNVYKELHADLQLPIAAHGDLSTWADQGVFLLNAILTVEAGKAASHRNIGWENFTDAVIKTLSEHRQNIVFMLWGNFAKSKAALINKQKHLVLLAAHPSPLARGAYFGSKHFSQANKYLAANNIQPINWTL